jgi:predicted Zn-dependent peptidase
MVYDSPDSWVEILANQLLWPNHPLGQNVAGTHQSLTGMNRESLVSFYKASYHPHNILVALAGAFEPKEIVAEIISLLGDWQPAPVPEFKAVPDPQTKARWYVEHRPIEQGHLCLALPALPRTDPDRYALSMLNAILGDGMSSRLFLTIREEKGLAYAIDSSLSLLQDTGSMVIYAGVDPNRVTRVLQAILDELDRLCNEPIPEKELRKTKEFVKGRLVLGLEDSFSQAAWVAYQTLFMDSVKTPEEVIQIFDAITAADVQAVAQKIIKPACYNLAAIGPFGQEEKLGQLIAG